MKISKIHLNLALDQVSKFPNVQCNCRHPENFCFQSWQDHFELLISFVQFEDSLLDKHNEESFFKYNFQNCVLVSIYLHR